MADKYAINDKVFAKLKGFPPWPAKIMEKIFGTGKDEKYRIIFYGSHDEASVKVDQIFTYNETTKGKYGNSRKAQFKEAMAEIEADTGELAADIPEEGPIDSATNEGEGVGDTTKGDSDGELMIDEGPPSLPPVLKREIGDFVKREIEKLDIPETAGNKTNTKRQRTLSKRDSLTVTSVTPAAGGTPITANDPTPSTPTLEGGSQPGIEIVSRSGRKIKPKRFADEEISTGRRGRSSGADEGQPATKKAKRGSTSAAKSLTPLKPGTEVVSEFEKEATEIPLKVKATPTKGKSTAGRMSPDILAAPSLTADTKGPPTLKAMPKRGAAATSGVNKPIPALEPATRAPSKTEQSPVRKSERQTRSNSIDGKEDVPLEDAAASRAPELEEEGEVDKENSNGEQSEATPMPIANNEQRVDDSKFTKPRPKDFAHAPPPPNTERKIRVATKNGLKIELSFDTKSPPGWNSEQWQSTATQNVRKVIEDLKEGDIESQELINSAAEGIACGTLAETKSREKLTSQLRLLRVEGEVIEIIGEIVGCLGYHSADCIRAMDLLDRLMEHDLNPLMLKKHPEVVHTVQKLRSYIGNIDAWNFTEIQREEFEVFASEIRKKSQRIFIHFQELFGIEPSSETFGEVFREEVRKFKDVVEQLPLKQMLGLTEENGELHELAMDLNGGMEFEADDTHE